MNYVIHIKQQGYLNHMRNFLNNINDEFTPITWVALAGYGAIVSTLDNIPIIINFIGLIIYTTVIVLALIATWNRNSQ